MDLIFDRSFDPRHGEAVSVAPGVRRVTARNAGPFTFHGTNTFLIGRDSLAVLDPGPADAAHIEAMLAAIAGNRVAHILVSHAHRDHSEGARLLQAKTGAPILAAVPNRSDPAQDGSRSAPVEAGAEPDFGPDIELVDGALVEGPGYRLDAIATPGHARDHLAFALADRNVIFSGDHVMGWSTTVVAPPDGSMADYMASLRRLAARQESRYLPAHGGAIDNAHAYVRALYAHRKMREAAILQRLRSGDRELPAIVSRIYGGLDPGLRPAATLSALAHLEDLVSRGIVAADGEIGPAARYWLTGAPLSFGGDDEIATGGARPAAPSRIG